jgi:hypothetical protein
VGSKWTARRSDREFREARFAEKRGINRIFAIDKMALQMLFTHHFSNHRFHLLAADAVPFPILWIFVNELTSYPAPAVYPAVLSFTLSSEALDSCGEGALCR